MRVFFSALSLFLFLTETTDTRSTHNTFRPQMPVDSDNSIFIRPLFHPLSMSSRRRSHSIYFKITSSEYNIVASKMCDVNIMLSPQCHLHKSFAYILYCTHDDVWCECPLSSTLRKCAMESITFQPGY